MQLPQLPQLHVEGSASPTLHLLLARLSPIRAIAKHGADGLHLQLHALHLVDDHLTLVYLWHIPIRHPPKANEPDAQPRLYRL